MTLYQLQQAVRCMLCGEAIETGAGAWRLNDRGVNVGYMHTACQEQDAQSQSEQKGPPKDGDGKDKSDGKGKDKGDNKEPKPQPRQEQNRPRPQDWKPTGNGSSAAAIVGSVVAVHFDSLSDMDMYGLQKMSNRDNETLRKSFDSQVGEKWLGVETRKQVHDMANDGWPAGVERMRKAFGELTNLLKPESIRRRFQWSDNGDEFDIHRAWSGHFDTAWRRMPKRTVTAPLVIRLVVDVCDNAGTSADAMFWRGAVCLWLTDALQEAGYHVEVIAAVATSSSGRCGNTYLSNLLTTTVKESRAPLEINTLATMTALAGTFRVYGFNGIVRSMDEVGGRADSGLGRATTYEYARKEMGADPVRGEYILKNVRNAAEGKAEITRLVALIQGETTKEGKAAA